MARQTPAQPCGKRLGECIDDVCRNSGECAWPPPEVVDGCRHVPPCATPAAHREAQREDWRKALSARAAAARARRGRRPAPEVTGVEWRPATGSGP